MGKDDFDEWLSFGTSGSDILLERMTKNGFKGVTPELILGFCSALVEFGFELRTSQLRNARERTKKLTGRCEGRKPFGALTGEAETLAQILTLRDDGLSADDIAKEFNGGTRFPTRHGKPWRATSIRKILARRTEAVLSQQRKQAEKDALAKQAVLLRQRGMKYTQIAAELNKELVEHPTTPKAISKLVSAFLSQTIEKGTCQ